jgi:SUMO ligase MMS21 Smc5/6 complex component
LKNTIVILFSILFISLIVTPTIINLIDDTQEILVLFDVEEEEETEGKESAKDLKIKTQSTEITKYILLSKNYKKKNTNFCSKEKYTLEFSSKNTPPPQIFL